jgi:hypothetical protein
MCVCVCVYVRNVLWCVGTVRCCVSELGEGQTCYAGLEVEVRD